MCFVTGELLHDSAGVENYHGFKQPSDDGFPDHVSFCGGNDVGTPLEGSCHGNSQSTLQAGAIADRDDLLLPPSDVDWLDLALLESEDPSAMLTRDPVLLGGETPFTETRQICGDKSLEQQQQHAVIAREQGSTLPSAAGSPKQQISPLSTRGGSWDLSVQRAASSMEDCYLPWTRDTRMSLLVEPHEP